MLGVVPKEHCATVCDGAKELLKATPSPRCNQSFGSQRLSLALVHGLPPHQTHASPPTRKPLYVKPRRPSLLLRQISLSRIAPQERAGCKHPNSMPVASDEVLTGSGALSELASAAFGCRAAPLTTPGTRVGWMAGAAQCAVSKAPTGSNAPEATLLAVAYFSVEKGAHTAFESPWHAPPPHQTQGSSSDEMSLLFKHAIFSEIARQPVLATDKQCINSGFN
mmetsp:Transcript_12583/g.29955  ORF Transcript_12583/g.29955 Transcript_12583/m.29955 type:complete len:222 (+) Transcript_12583:644-1309(+)